MATQTPTIMVIEDDAMLSLMFERLFSASGMNVETAFNGEDAINKSKVIAPPTIILLDLMMPRVDGFKVIETFKQDPIWKNIPIIVFSNLGDIPDQERAIKMGAEEYMIKSQFSPKEVVARIHELVEKHQQQDEAK